MVHRNADDGSVYSLSHAPTGRVILTEATGSPDPLVELTNRLGRMTDWAALDAAEGINQLVPPGQEAIIAEVDRSIRNIRLRPAADDGV